jgi:hypothetical protein
MQNVLLVITHRIALLTLMSLQSPKDVVLMNNNNQETNKLLHILRDPRTIRNQSQRILTLAKQDKLAHFGINPKKAQSTVAYIIDVINTQYPDLNIPYHSRWRHFEMDHIDRINKLKQQIALPTCRGLSAASKDPADQPLDIGYGKNCNLVKSRVSAIEWGKILYELVIISVFLDAGSGPLWRYKEQSTGKEYSRSEGLACASLELYQSGTFSANSKEPFRVDAKRLVAFTEQDLKKGFQVTAENPLEGINGRLALLNRLGTLIQNNNYFGDEGRLGDFYLHIHSLQSKSIIKVEYIFQAILNAFSGLWPNTLSFHGCSLGDVGKHSALKSSDFSSEFIPFHKLSQWLAYSLIEPLEQARIKVIDLDILTALPEYRNGGLLVDSELLVVKNKDLLEHPQDTQSEAIIEWRALTIALIDELAIPIRQQLHQDKHTLPLAKILQGGTWEAGRQIAKQKRPYGTPPIQIISDGTVF